MSAQVHYDANIYFISLIIRDLRRGCTLSIDPSYFLDKIIEDIMFCDESLKTLMNSLGKNDHLVNQEKHLRDLYLAKRDLVLLLQDLIGEELPFSSEIRQYVSRFTQIIRGQKEDMMEIDDSLNATIPQGDEKNIVSQQEYQILFDDSQDEQ